MSRRPLAQSSPPAGRPKNAGKALRPSWEPISLRLAAGRKRLLYLTPNAVADGVATRCGGLDGPQGPWGLKQDWVVRSLCQLIVLRRPAPSLWTGPSHPALKLTVPTAHKPPTDSPPTPLPPAGNRRKSSSSRQISRSSAQSAGSPRGWRPPRHRPFPLWLCGQATGAVAGRRDSPPICSAVHIRLRR